MSARNVVLCLVRGVRSASRRAPFLYSARRRVLMFRRIGSGVPWFRTGVRCPSHVTVTYACTVYGLSLIRWSSKCAGV